MKTILIIIIVILIFVILYHRLLIKDSRNILYTECKFAINEIVIVLYDNKAVKANVNYIYLRSDGTIEYYVYSSHFSSPHCIRYYEEDILKLNENPCKLLKYEN